MYVYFNPNPARRVTSDCVIRAVCKLMDIDWDTAFLKLSYIAFIKKDSIEKGHVWGDFLKLNGYRRGHIPDSCPDCYTVENFCVDHPKGRYLLRIDGMVSGHVVTVVDGDYYDTWESGGETVEYFYY